MSRGGFRMKSLISETIRLLGKMDKLALHRASELLEQRITAAQNKNETINSFWFEDQKWKQEEADGTIKASHRWCHSIGRPRGRSVRMDSASPSRSIGEEINHFCPRCRWKRDQDSRQRGHRSPAARLAVIHGPTTLTAHLDAQRNGASSFPPERSLRDRTANEARQEKREKPVEGTGERNERIQKFWTWAAEYMQDNGIDEAELLNRFALTGEPNEHATGGRVMNEQRTTTKQPPSTGWHRRSRNRTRFTFGANVANAQRHGRISRLRICQRDAPAARWFVAASSSAAATWRKSGGGRSKWRL